MGFTYLGPIDGHDLSRLCDVLTWAKEIKGPVLVHVHTQKGKATPLRSVIPANFTEYLPLTRKPACR